tara:strand:- start:1192 stop:1671 length:480 start_codon:yes stop_codon:yes gene_type:complete
MITFRKKKTEVKFYDSIEEMPHRRYMKFNKEMMRANEVGNSMTDVIKRIDRAMGFIQAKESDKAVRELSNARLAYSYSQAELEPKGLALAAMVKSINGVEVDDITASGLQNTLEVLQNIGMSKRELDQNADSVKKKLSKSLKFSFLSSLMGRISSIIRR